MHITKINNTPFNRGIIRLANIKSESLSTYDAINKFADDKGVNIFIAKNRQLENLPYQNLYTVIAKKITESESSRGTSFASMNKKVCKEEVSVKIYNAVINAVEMLEKNLAKV